MAKIGDTVRYLNAVGGGTITRIEGNIAYVEEDGFETPVLLKECVVVSSGAKVSSPKETPAVSSVPLVTTKEEKTEPELEIVETPEGDKLNIVLGYEPADLLKLSDVNIDTYLVNDSNYYLYFTYSTSPDGKDWSTRYAGLVEPNIQLYLETLDRDNIADMERVAIQFVAFKKDKPYELKNPASVEFRFDATKFFRRHCFKPNDYFESDVIALEVVRDDQVNGKDSMSDQLNILKDIKENALRQTKRPVIKRKKRATKPDGDLVIDLHIDELLDTTKGMSSSDILNYQIDEFRRVMDENLKNRGRKIVFIHGKGEGVLRNALLKELNHRYKNHEVQDASFREYGFGATQVTIR